MYMLRSVPQTRAAGPNSSTGGNEGLNPKRRSSRKVLTHGGPMTRRTGDKSTISPQGG